MRCVLMGLALATLLGLSKAQPAFAHHEPCIVTGARCLPVIADADAAMQLLLQQHDALVLDQPEDGCAPRAVLISEMLEAAGFSPESIGKVWNVAVDPRAPEVPANHVLRIFVPGRNDSSTHTVYWGWHVAVTLDVNTGEDRFETLILDPTLFDHPVRLREWRRAMHDRAAKTYYSRLGESPGGQGIGYGFIDDPALTERDMHESAAYHLEQMRSATNRPAP